MTEQQRQLIEPILATIKNDDIREFALTVLNDTPSYIFSIGASSTAKFHPQYALGEFGLMRHQIAVVRFMNYFFELEQYNSKFTDREMDLLRVSGLTHDCMKSGTQDDFNRSKWTKFDHPIQMANKIRSYDGQYLNHDEIEFVAHCIESHMGQFNTDKKSSVVLPKPTDVYQEIVHLCDYLASRKDLTMAFDNAETPKVTPANVDDYIISFGKHKGEKLTDVFNIDRSYCMWLKENSYMKDVVDMIKQIGARQTEEDEI